MLPRCRKGCRILQVSHSGDMHLDLRDLMCRLGRENIDSILLEGGGRLNWSALQSGIVHRVMAYISPKLFGGASAMTPVAGQGIPDPAQAFMLENASVTRFGGDFLIEGELQTGYSV